MRRRSNTRCVCACICVCVRLSLSRSPTTGPDPKLDPDSVPVPEPEPGPDPCPFFASSIHSNLPFRSAKSRSHSPLLNPSKQPVHCARPFNHSPLLLNLFKLQFALPLCQVAKSFPPPQSIQTARPLRPVMQSFTPPPPQSIQTPICPSALPSRKVIHPSSSIHPMAALRQANQRVRFPSTGLTHDTQILLTCFPYNKGYWKAGDLIGFLLSVFPIAYSLVACILRWR